MPSSLPPDKLALPDSYSEETKDSCEHALAVMAMHLIERLCERGLLDLCNSERHLRSAMPRESDPDWNAPVPSGLTYEHLFGMELLAIAEARVSLSTLLAETRETIETFRRADEVDALP